MRSIKSELLNFYRCDGWQTNHGDCALHA